MKTNRRCKKAKKKKEIDIYRHEGCLVSQLDAMLSTNLRNVTNINNSLTTGSAHFFFTTKIISQLLNKIL